MKRFFYVASPRGSVLHIQYGKTHSASQIACGRESDKGWSWFAKHSSNMPVCKQCRA